MKISRCVPAVCIEASANTLQVAAQKCKQALADSAVSYEQLLAKYVALEKSIATYAQAPGQKEEPVDGQEYVLVLVNAHSHRVGICTPPLRYQANCV
jgi:hypothetical protein